MEEIIKYLAASLHKEKKPLREHFALNSRALSRLAGISPDIPTASFLVVCRSFYLVRQTISLRSVLKSNAWFKVKAVFGGSLKYFILLLMLLWVPYVYATSVEIAVEETQVISHTPQYYIGWPTVGLLKNGDLMVVYSGGRDYHICPFGRVEMMRSRDGGKTWSWPRVILDSLTDDRDAGIVQTKKGTVLVSSFTSLAYQQHLQNPNILLRKVFGDKLEEHLVRWRLVEGRSSQQIRESDVGMWLVRSEDDGKTWSARIPAPCNSPHGPIVLRDGRLLYAGKELNSDTQRVGIWESKDDGVSWDLLAYFPIREGDDVSNYHELHATEAADGTIIVHIRDHNQKPRSTLQTESHDGGKSWSIPHGIGVLGYPSHLLKLQDDRLLMTYGMRTKPFGIRGKVSADNGQTWSEEFRLTEDALTWDLGYPSTVQLQDGSLLTVWYESPGEKEKAVLRRIKWRVK